MQAGEALVAAGGKRAEVGRELIRWASDDLKVYAGRSYDPKWGTFLALMTDGTPIRWRESKTGYYVPSSFAPVEPDGVLLWGYATAYRLTGDEEHWRMVRAIAKSLDLGDVGQPAAQRSLRTNTANQSWSVIYALLELARATDDRAFLQLASRVGDNVLKTQSASGLFPRPGRLYARTGDEAPLALLHLAAVLDGKQSLLPPPTLDSRFFHCEFDGPLEDYQKKRADKRTYDDLVFYGGR
jgi:pectate lyase